MGLSVERRQHLVGGGKLNPDPFLIREQQCIYLVLRQWTLHIQLIINYTNHRMN